MNKLNETDEVSNMNKEMANADTMKERKDKEKKKRREDSMFKVVGSINMK
jgi:hypothetical protein